MLAVTVDADRSAWQPRRHGLSVHAFRVCFCNVGVALAAGGWNIVVIDLRSRTSRRQNVMTAMTVGASCGRAVAVHYRSSVHALPVKLDWMGDGNPVSR